MSKTNNADLERQISEIKREITRLSAILALRELEERHPLLEKLTSKAEQEKRRLGASYQHWSSVARQHLDEGGLRKDLSILGAVLAIGSAGYAILALLGLMGEKRK